MDFTDRLKELRKNKGLNQRDFAELLHVQPSAYNKWEKGVNRPDHENLCLIARNLNITTDYLLGVDAAPTRVQSDVQAVTGLSPEAIERLRGVWQGNREQGYIPPAIKAVNDLIVQKDMSVLANIAAYLYFEGPPRTVTMEYDGQPVTVTFSQESMLQNGVMPALRDLSQQKEESK